MRFSLSKKPQGRAYYKGLGTQKLGRNKGPKVFTYIIGPLVLTSYKKSQNIKRE